MKLILSLTLIISSYSYSQKGFKSINLSDSENKINTDYLHKLDSVFAHSKLIGMGESTHGTSEFTVIRTEIFKYLVQKHNYTVFFLEADFNACSRVNRYIRGADDNPKDALQEVRLWPWLTQELLDFIGWMRTYNESHDNILEFVGCDMQLIVDDKTELQRIFSTNIDFQNYLQDLPSLDFDAKDSIQLNSKQKEWIEFSDNILKHISKTEKLMINTVSQWFENETGNGFKANFRDSCMGNNIADYLELNPTAKGIYFAHNGHVGMISNQGIKNDPLFRRAGHFIKERLNDNYFAIALEFTIGSFNAINYIDNEYVMEVFDINKNKRKSFASVTMGKDDNVKFVFNKSITRNDLLLNQIGAIYGKSKEGYKIYRYRNVGLKDFHAYIIINQGTPTNLLNKQPMKISGEKN